MAGTFRGSFGGKGYHVDWNGFQCLATAAEAARRATNKVNNVMADEARATEMWENDTGQTRAAVFVKGAVIEAGQHGLHVWGEWGIEDRPRFKIVAGETVPAITYHDGVYRPLTTKDVALFLEFGTVTMQPRPWLYPAWDANKYMYPIVVKEEYALVAGSGAATGIRNPKGQFMSHDVLRTAAQLAQFIDPESV